MGFYGLGFQLLRRARDKDALGFRVFGLRAWCLKVGVR